jgi:hypothetical protein
MGRAVFIFFIALSVMPSMAAAETMSFAESTALLAKSCADEIDANCRGVNLDTNRMKECLSRNRDTLSARCADNYLKTFDAIQKRIAARTTVANACAREIVKTCAGSTKETSKSIPCLTTAQGVSARCIQAMGDAGYR